MSTLAEALNEMRRIKGLDEDVAVVEAAATLLGTAQEAKPYKFVVVALNMTTRTAAIATTFKPVEECSLVEQEQAARALAVVGEAVQFCQRDYVVDPAHSKYAFPTPTVQN